MRRLFLTTLALAALASCSKEPQPSVVQSPLLLTSQIETRAFNTSWEMGDQIGVYMFKHQTQETVGAANTLYSTPTDSAQADFTAQGTPLYYPQEGMVDIFAYYPYTDQMNGMEYAVDVNSQVDMSAIDLMVASKLGIPKSEDALPILFKHRLTKITVQLQPGEGVTSEQLADASITIAGLKTEATYNITTSSITLAGDAKPIALNVDGLSANNLIAEGITIPQSSTIDIVITTSTYGEFKPLTFEAKEFAQGVKYTYTITVQRTGIHLNGDVEIQDWIEKRKEPVTAE